jgi:hypothetical protein
MRLPTEGERARHGILARSSTKCVILCAVVLAGAAKASGQAPATPDSTRKDSSVVITPGARYEAGSFKRTVFGSGWRDLWTTPVTAPVLDIDTYADGLELAKRGGGAQSLVLHFKEKHGWREYRFRSVDKYPLQSMAPELKGTLVGRIFQDRVSTLLPGAPTIVHPLLEAVGVLHVPADLYVMGDTPSLQHVRDTVAGMLGTFELKGEEAPDNKPGFAGSRAIKGVEKFHEDLASSREHRLNEREFLAARLVDFLINDPDRSLDNYDWARFGEKGAYVWRPIPRDRDQAFIDARGLVNALLFRPLLPTLMTFGPSYDLNGLTYSTYVHDRRLLQRLAANDFRDVALRVQSAITDSVIARVIDELPVEWRERTNADERLWSALRARRDALPSVAAAFYRQLAGEVDIHGTDDADHIEVLRHPDGRVTVTITDPSPPRIVAERRDSGRIVTTSDGTVIGARESELGPYFDRTFIPGETKEIRLYAGGGDDVAVISGAASDVITVRLIGGKGDDVLVDSAAGGGSILYDAEGSNRFGAPRGTRVSTRPWKPLAPEMGMRMGSDWAPDWGGSKGWQPSLDHKEGAGLIIGAGPAFRSYGFRRLPYHWDVSSQLLVGTGNGRLGFSVNADYRAENSPRAYQLSATATQLETTRFFGYGNDTPRASRRASLVNQTMVAVEPSRVWQLGWRKREGTGNALRGEDTLRTGLRPTVGELRVGPTITWIDPDPAPGSPLSLNAANGGRSFGVAGAALGLELDRTDDDAVPTMGYKVEADVAAYPLLMGSVGDAFGTARARASTYVPLTRGGEGPHLAFRLGAATAMGGYPAQYAAAIGGRSSVRGFSARRFAGDVATDGSAELRVPVGTVNVFIRSRLGVFALADAGRVWFDGRSDGGWHYGVGGGIWVAALGRSVSVAYARGEGGRLYVKGGPFF